MRYHSEKSRGFSILETLVAIAVLMIAIAGPLAIANKGLQAATFARDQMVATYLAQETMEYMKNLRDNNIDAGNAWFNGFGGSCINAGGNYCDADPRDGFVQANCPGAGTDQRCRLYLDVNGYNHSSQGTPTPFYRYFNITDETKNGQPANTEDTAHVYVSWMEGTVPYGIDVSSEFVNTTR